MEKQILIKRPISEVFDYVADCRNSKGYLGTNFHFEPVSPPPYGVGTKAVAVGSYMGIPIRLNYVMNQYEENKLLRLVASKQVLNGVPVNSEACWRFQQRGPGETLINFKLTIQPNLSMFGMFGSMMAAPIIGAAEASVSRMLDGAMAQLKRTLERVPQAA